MTPNASFNWIRVGSIALIIHALAWAYWAGEEAQKIANIDNRLQRIECKLYDGCAR